MQNFPMKLRNLQEFEFVEQMAAGKNSFYLIEELLQQKESLFLEQMSD